MQNISRTHGVKCLNTRHLQLKSLVANSCQRRIGAGRNSRESYIVLLQLTKKLSCWRFWI